MTILNGIKAISFDVDGTLWNFESVMRRSLSQVLQELKRIDPVAAAQLDVDLMIDIRERVHTELMGTGKDLVEVRRESLRQILKDVGRPNEEIASRLFDVYFKHRHVTAQLYDDVLPTLESLRGMYTLGILSNGNTYPDQLGLEGVFDFVVFSEEHGGIEKPDPRLFHIAIEAAGCAANEFLHVGDHLVYDVLGAATAGVRSVWLNRDGEAPHPDMEVDREIGSLWELVGMLC